MNPSKRICQSHSTTTDPMLLLLMSRIWFLLYDASTALPYKGTTASAVSLPPGSDVDQFRDAVKAKNSDILTGFTSSQLLVYKKYTPFDKRNVAAAAAAAAAAAGVEEGMEEPPLEEDSLVDGLGTSKKDALVVVVPSFIQQSSETKPTITFPLCQEPFFTGICDATENDGWLSFGQDIPGTLINKLYIRDYSYRKIASYMTKKDAGGIKKFIMTGTPGIGKSLFLVYLLWTLVKKQRRVLFVYDPFTIYYDGKGGVFKAASDHAVPDADAEDSFWDDTLWFLFDTNGTDDDHVDEFPHDRCHFVLSTSPRPELMKELQTSFHPTVYYLPIWTEEELEVIAPLFPPAQDCWRDRFEILGGVPRTVLEDTTQDPTEMLKAACNDLALDDILTYQKTFLPS